MPDERFPKDSFPRQSARTRGFALGAPKSFVVAPDGGRVAFLRSRAGADPRGCLWTFDVDERDERLVFDPAKVMADEEHLTDEERDLRERLRERLTGVTSFATDDAVRVAAFALEGRLHLADLVDGGARELPAAPDVFDPRPDPSGRRVAYVATGGLRIIDVASGAEQTLASDEDPDVSWGMAEFVAAEEMGRRRGFWWSPDGARIAAARVDERSVETWYIASPVDPAEPPRAVRYPRAGTANADVRLSVLGVDGGRVDVDWDIDAFPYLVRVVWADVGPLTILVQSRDQKTWQVRTVDPAHGTTALAREDHDDAWLHIVDGVPAWLPDGRLLMVVDREDTRRLVAGDEPLTPEGLHVAEVVDVGGERAIVLASDDPTEMHVFATPLDAGPVIRMTDRPGLHRAAAAGGVVVITSSTMDEDGSSTAVHRGKEMVATLDSFAERPLITPRPTFFLGGQLELREAVLTPNGEKPDAPLPVLLDPYGGPAVNTVRKSRMWFLESQWFADQGFAVLVADGRGTPGRGPAWEKLIHLDPDPVSVQDQVDALDAAAERFAFLDLSRVAIRGWSYGGFLAAAAVLRRPDVFHAAVSGAPVTDDHLYDTHYTERYDGMPDEHPEAYAAFDLIADAPKLTRPLMVIHGMADDNVHVANTLRLSRALMEAGRPHTVLPLSGITHAPFREEVAENLLLLQVRFLRQALGIPEPA